MGYIVYMIIVFNKYLYFLRMFMLYFKIRDVVGDGIQLLGVLFIRSMIVCKYMQLYKKLKYCIVFEKKIFKEDVRLFCIWYVRIKM